MNWGISDFVIAGLGDLYLSIADLLEFRTHAPNGVWEEYKNTKPETSYVGTTQSGTLNNYHKNIKSPITIQIPAGN